MLNTPRFFDANASDQNEKSSKTRRVNKKVREGERWIETHRMVLIYLEEWDFFNITTTFKSQRETSKNGKTKFNNKVDSIQCSLALSHSPC